MCIMEWCVKSTKENIGKDQRLAFCRILGVMKSTAYDTVNVISQIPPLELRRQQEEVKLFHRCKKYSERFPRHNLSVAYQLWKNNHHFEPGVKFCWMEKLSTLSRAYINIS